MIFAFTYSLREARVGLGHKTSRRKLLDKVSRPRIQIPPIKQADVLWRHGWDLNPRMTVLQTAALNHFATAPYHLSRAFLRRRTSLQKVFPF